MGEDIGHQVENFKRKRGVKFVIAFSGGSEEKSERAERLVKEMVGELAFFPVAILTGGTKWGIPKVAAEAARAYGLPVIGVLPERGLKHALEGLDLRLTIPPRLGQSAWGDESEVFAKLSDAVIMISGAFGTQVEYAHIMKMNEARLKDGAAPVYVIPFFGLGGWSETVYNLNLPEAIRACFPSGKILAGEDAVAFIKARLFSSVQ